MGLRWRNWPAELPSRLHAAVTGKPHVPCARAATTGAGRRTNGAVLRDTLQTPLS